jgi:hypothetical protein
MIEERADCKILLEGSGLTEEQTSRTRPLGKRATPLWVFTLTSLIVILLSSLGLWWVVWKSSSP